MPDLKEVFQNIIKTKKEKRKLNEAYRDALANSKSYQEILEKIKENKVKKLQYETTIREDFAKEMEEDERLSNDIKSNVQMLSDMAVTQFLKGENIEFSDENDTKYEPVFKVTYKKQG
jgi:hypothetical protein